MERLHLTSIVKIGRSQSESISVPDDKAIDRGCTELGKAEGRECEELVLVYRPSGCIREKNEVDLNETITVKAGNVKSSPDCFGKIGRERKKE